MCLPFAFAAFIVEVVGISDIVELGFARDWEGRTAGVGSNPSVPMVSRWTLLLLLQRQYHSDKAKRMAANPPITPPTIAPILGLLELLAEGEDDVEVDDDVGFGDPEAVMVTREGAFGSMTSISNLSTVI